MKTTTKMTRTTTHTVEGQLDFQALVKEVCKMLPLGDHTDVKIELFVNVPGGGDWSNTELECDLYPVQFRATWTETQKS